MCSSDLAQRLVDVAPTVEAKALVNHYMLTFVIRREQVRAFEFESMPHRHVRSGLPGLQGVPGTAAIEQADTGRLRALLDGFLGDLPNLRADYYFEGVLVLATDLVAALDDAEAAGALAERLLPCSGRFVMFAHTTPLGWVDTALSTLLRVHGDVERAVALAEQARLADDARWHGLWGGWARAAEAAARRRRDAPGDVALAARLERAARTTARRTGSRRLDAAVRRRP